MSESSAAQFQAPVIFPPSALETFVLEDTVPGPYLLFDLRGDPGDPRHAAWLRSQPFPVLGLVRPNDSNPLADACDVLASSVDALSSTIANITHAPLAAALLVETLRVTENMPATDALAVESLAYATLQTGPDFRRWIATRKASRRRPPSNEPPLITSREGNRMCLTLNRPKSRNAVSIEMRDALVEAFSLAALDPDIETVDVFANGACFSVGGDLSEFGSVPNPAEGHLIRMQRLPARALLPVAARTVFHLHGACIGAGVELPAFARHVVARPNTFFQLPEIHLGLIPGAGGCVSLPRRIGRQRTAYLALSARRISARTALGWRLIDEITR
ncbi:MAG TPA: enoyl-CoA hydratase/isomerase family protein [Rhizomicrobium sp.]|nr:enoyl-CoA hydratase/isomerase family protein [Rhizomicrobium sp.]